MPNTTKDDTRRRKRPPPSSSTSENSSFNQPKNSEISVADSENQMHEKSENSQPKSSFKIPRRPAKIQRIENTAINNNTEETLLVVQQLIQKSPQLLPLDYLQFQTLKQVTVRLTQLKFHESLQMTLKGSHQCLT